jgi:predicted transposase YdaD
VNTHLWQLRREGVREEGKEEGRREEGRKEGRKEFIPVFFRLRIHPGGASLAGSLLTIITEEQ